MIRPALTFLASVAALAVLLLLAASPQAASAGGGCHGNKTRLPFSDEKTTSVAATECSFMPAVARIDVGQTVRFHNKDEAPHTFTGVLQTWGDYKEYQQGESTAYTFDKSGVYPYFCELHPGMAAAIVVGDGTAASAGTASKAVSAVSGGQAEAPETEDALTEEEAGGGATTEIVAGAALLGAILGGVALSPFALRRLRSRG